MAKGVGEYLVGSINRRGMVVFVDTDGVLKYYPEQRMTKAFLRLLNAHYYQVKYFVIADALTA